MLKTCRQTDCAPLGPSENPPRFIRCCGARGEGRFLFESERARVANRPVNERFNYHRPACWRRVCPGHPIGASPLGFINIIGEREARSYTGVSKLESILLPLLLFRVFEINALLQRYAATKFLEGLRQQGEGIGGQIPIGYSRLCRLRVNRESD